MAWPIYTINELTLRQSVTPDHLLGRVNSAMNLLFYGILPVGRPGGGLIAESIGMRITMLAGAPGPVLSALWLTALPHAARLTPQHSSPERARFMAVKTLCQLRFSKASCPRPCAVRT